MDDLDRSIARECRRDPEFARIWKESRPYSGVITSIHVARINREWELVDLARAAGVSEADIERLEDSEYDDPAPADLIAAALTALDLEDPRLSDVAGA